jgi:hypothetical protein
MHARDVVCSREKLAARNGKIHLTIEFDEMKLSLDKFKQRFMHVLLLPASGEPLMP